MNTLQKNTHAIVATKDVKILSRQATPGEPFRERCERRIIHTARLMTVVIDFGNGPWTEPDPMHSHPHEQTTYVASGEILFISQDQQPVRMTAGDLYAIPPDVPHTIQLLSKTACLIDSFTPVRDDFL